MKREMLQRIYVDYFFYIVGWISGRASGLKKTRTVKGSSLEDCGSLAENYAG